MFGAALTLGCTGPKPDIYRVPEIRGEIMFRDFIWKSYSDIVMSSASDSVFYNRAFYLKNVYLDTAFFSEREGPDFEDDFRDYERDNLLDSIEPGTETYLVLFRNYSIRNFPNSPGSFQVIVNIVDGVPNLRKSIIYSFSTSEFHPNPAWFPREINFADDSIELKAGNNHTRDSIWVRAKVHPDSLFDLAGYRLHFKAMHKLW